MKFTLTIKAGELKSNVHKIECCGQYEIAFEPNPVNPTDYYSTLPTSQVCPNLFLKWENPLYGEDYFDCGDRMFSGLIFESNENVTVHTRKANGADLKNIPYGLAEIGLYFQAEYTTPRSTDTHLNIMFIPAEGGEMECLPTRGVFGKINENGSINELFAYHVDGASFYRASKSAYARILQGEIDPEKYILINGQVHYKEHALKEMSDHDRIYYIRPRNRIGAPVYDRVANWTVRIADILLPILDYIGIDNLPQNVSKARSELLELIKIREDFLDITKTHDMPEISAEIKKSVRSEYLKSHL